MASNSEIANLNLLNPQKKIVHVKNNLDNTAKGLLLLF